MLGNNSKEGKNVEEKSAEKELEIDINGKVNNWVDLFSRKSLNVDGLNANSREDAIGGPPVINNIRNFGVENEVNSRAVEDIENMGLLDQSNEIFSPKSIKTGKQKSNWEFSVDKNFGEHVKSGCVSEKEGSKVEEELEDRFSSSEIEEKSIEAERVFFPEFESKKQRNKRYGSLRCFQDKAISEIERKTRDRAIHREKKKAKGWDFSELSGRSLSDSDLVHRWELSIKEARKALNLGKSLGIKIEGNEDEAVRELARLELNEFRGEIQSWFFLTER
ncbi:hypothetical protein GQ457_05G026460 [Hibiscus cannabinus]